MILFSINNIVCFNAFRLVLSNNAKIFTSFQTFL